MNIFRAPTDCVQYFTGTAGSVKSYNYAGGQILAGQRYNNCIRTSDVNRSIGSTTGCTITEKAPTRAFS